MTDSWDVVGSVRHMHVWRNWRALTFYQPPDCRQQFLTRILAGVDDKNCASYYGVKLVLHAKFHGGLKSSWPV